MNNLPKPELVKFNDIAPLLLQEYERYLPTAFDESMTLLQKVNKIIQYMNTIGRLTTEVITKWNQVMDWVLNEGLNEAVVKRLNEMLASGELEEVVREALKHKVDREEFDEYIKNMDKNFNDFKTNIDRTLLSIQSTVQITDAMDITKDVQRAMDKLKFGGVLYIPYGDYTMHGYVELKSNIHVIAPKGTIIRKTLSSVSAYTFLAGKEYGTRGYGGGGRNITIEGITFVGKPLDDKTYFANGLAFNHVDELLIKDCAFNDCMYAGHCVDLAGCSNVLIDNCSFAGQWLIEGREYAEAIQIDSSTPGSIGNWAGVDGLPTKNVTVENCEFIPSLNSLAPNPIGNHGYTGGMYYENITFKNNIVINAQRYSAGGWRGWIHFYGTKNVKIIDNTFRNTESIPCNVIQFLTSSGGRYDPVTLASGSGEPVVHQNIEVSDNIFEGFNSPDPYTIIRGYGTTYQGVEYDVYNFKVRDNQFINCGAKSMIINQSSAHINIYHFENVTVTGNLSDRGKLMCSIWDGKNLTVSQNIGSHFANCMMYVAEVKNCTMIGNTGEDMRRPIEIEETTGLTCIGNVHSDVIQYEDNNYANKFRNVSHATIMGNVIETKTNTIKYGYYVYDTSDRTKHVNQFDNLAIGFTDRAVNVSGSLNFVNYNSRP